MFVRIHRLNQFVSNSRYLVLSSSQPGSDIVPVSDFEDCLHVVRPDILVLKIVSVLPIINSKQGHKSCGRLERVLVGTRGDLQLPGGLIVPQPAPSGALNCNSAGRQLLLHGGNTSKVADNCSLKISLRLSRASRAKVLPEDGVVEVAATVELKSSMQPNNRRNVVLGHSIRQLLLDHVEVVHVGLVVLAVVDLHNLGGDHWLQSVVVVRKIRQGVLSA